MSFKEALKKFWHFIWEEDSLLSWIVNVLLAFVIIKFLLYPGLGWVLGTPAPIVAVVSGSMEHEGNFEKYWTQPMCCNDMCSVQQIQGQWYEHGNLTRAQFSDFSFVNGFNKGDIMILYSPETVELGDVIVYLVPNRPDPIIHRVIKMTAENGKKFYWTKGDHNCETGGFEQRIPQEHVIGKAVWRMPLLGWVKIVAVDLWQLLTGGFR
jgi:signal peptidase I